VKDAEPEKPCRCHVERGEQMKRERLRHPVDHDDSGRRRRERDDRRVPRDDQRDDVSEPRADHSRGAAGGVAGPGEPAETRTGSETRAFWPSTEALNTADVDVSRTIHVVVACPVLSVTAVVGVTAPPRPVASKRTVTPGTVRPRQLVTRTVRGPDALGATTESGATTGRTSTRLNCGIAIASKSVTITSTMISSMIASPRAGARRRVGLMVKANITNGRARD